MGFFSLVLGYLLGSIPSGWLAGRWLKGIDLRELGSGSTGATNVLRQVGKGPALVVFLIDVGKGAAAVLIARALGLGDWIQVLAGLTALAGHIWPVWLGFKGGKAVATGLGLFLGLAWPVGLASFGVFLAVFSLSRYVSLASVLAAISLPLHWNDIGLPIGVQLVAAYGSEDLLLAVASQLEAAHPWAQRRPVLA